MSKYRDAANSSGWAVTTTGRERKARGLGWEWHLSGGNPVRGEEWLGPELRLKGIQGHECVSGFQSWPQTLCLSRHSCGQHTVSPSVCPRLVATTGWV